MTKTKTPAKKKSAKSKDWSGAVAASAQTSNGVPVHTPVERRRYKKKLPVRIDDAEVAVKADELAKVIHEREAVRLKRREANAVFREKLAFFDERLQDLATSVELHTETRDVVCIECLIVETNTVQTMRADTGEIVDTRGADTGDVQEAMFPADEPDLDDDGDVADEDFDEEQNHEQVAAAAELVP